MAEPHRRKRGGGKPSEAQRTSCFVAITGGYGAGKSAVASIIARTHPVLSSDRIAAEVMNGDQSVKAAVQRLLGSEAYTAEGILNRAYTADKVFGDPALLERLNAIVHPVVRRETDRRRKALEQEGRSLIFQESALVYEAKIEAHFDYVIAVIAEKENVLERLTAAGVSPAEIHRRLAGQLKPEEKASRADFVIQNNAGIEKLEEATVFIIGLIKRLCGER